MTIQARGVSPTVRLGRHPIRFAGFLLACLCVVWGKTSVAQDKSALSPSRLRLPNGPGSLDGIGENVEPEMNMGLASYSVAIDLPQGYAGATPTLRLAYSSGDGNSDVGIGWSLSVPSIERMTARGLPHYSTGDRIAANGSDELVRVSAAGVYRARYEGRFVKYTWVDAAGDGHNGYWKAEYPDGRIGYFGAGSDGSTVANAMDKGTQGTFRWHLVELVDALGHSLRYEYGKDGAVSHLQRITYVFDTQGKPKYEVDLSYEARPDQLSDGKPGFELRTSQRLVGISVLTNGVQLRRYQLKYETAVKSGGLSRLSAVQRFGVRDEGPFPVVFTFSYSAGLGSSTPGVVTMNGALGLDLRTGTADLNDLNGDALPDVVDTSLPLHRIFLSSLDSNGLPQFGAPVTSASGSATLRSKSVEMFDLDGDGHSDLVDSLNGRVLWNKGTGDWSDADQPTALSFPDFAGDRDLRPIDYDNDRLIDVIHSDASGTWIYANRGKGRFELVQAGVDAIGAGFTSDALQLADMNGDGMQDLVRRGSQLVAYRMNLGFGHFDEWKEVAGAPEEGSDEHWVDLNG
ncbi:MAG TPA: SpvB/TcaC N-terminal domain-containing protein, partial [Polyangiaceae bacterium]